MVVRHEEDDNGMHAMGKTETESGGDEMGKTNDTDREM